MSDILQTELRSRLEDAGFVVTEETTVDGWKVIAAHLSRGRFIIQRVQKHVALQEICDLVGA